MASWTVKQDDITPEEQQNATIAELLQKVVGENDGVEPRVPVFTPSKPGPFTKSSTVYTVGPQPLNPGDLSTPVKDPMQNFSSWVKTQQSPNSNSTTSRTSPTPMSTNGMYLNQGMQSPGSTVRALPLSQNTTPSKQFTQSPDVFSQPSPVGPLLNQHATPTAGMGTTQLEQIYEHRRQLMMQMEDLAMQEMELRKSPTQFGHENPAAPSTQTPAQLNPTIAQSPQQQNHFGAQMSIDNIRGKIYETAKDQHGCRYLQRLLDQQGPEAVEAAQIILGEILQHIPELMTDQYANFLVQKLFDMMPHDVRYNVAQVTAPHMPLISLTPHGTFSVQKLIETIATREEMEVVQAALKQDVVRLVKDVHGNHVIQKVLQRFEPEDTQFIFDAMTTDCVNIATNKQGCCVLQRCLEFASPQQRIFLVAIIVRDALQLIQDPFGNYVVQYVIDSRDTAINDKLAEHFLPHIVVLSMNKFSSNVVEKVLRGSSQGVKDSYVTAMLDQMLLLRLLRDDYGNYVVQTALMEATPALGEQLIVTLRPLMHHIRNAAYAKKLEAKMDICLKKKHGQGQPHQFANRWNTVQSPHNFAPQVPIQSNFRPNAAPWSPGQK